MGFIKRLMTKRVKSARSALAGETVVRFEPASNFFGQRSQGRRQVRGNGVLALTDSRLYFLLWKPERELVIPLNQITALSTPRSFLSKSKFKPLLQVDFQNDDFEPDAAAWLVADLDAWVAAFATVGIKTRASA